MEMLLSAIACAGLVALLLAAVVAVHHARLDRLERPTPGGDGLQENRLEVGLLMSGD